MSCGFDSTAYFRADLRGCATRFSGAVQRCHDQPLIADSQLLDTFPNGGRALRLLFVYRALIPADQNPWLDRVSVCFKR